MTTRRVILAFLGGTEGEGGNIHTDGLRLFSFGRLVAWHDGQTVNVKRFEPETWGMWRHRRDVAREALALGKRVERVE